MAHVDPAAQTRFGWSSNGLVISEPAGGSERLPIVKNSFAEFVKPLGSGTIFWLDDRSDSSDVIGTRKIPDGQGTLIKFARTHGSEPSVFSDPKLHQNYPNPFGSSSISHKSSTAVSFDLLRDEHVVLKIYDPLGREKAILKDAFLKKGNHIVSFYDTALPSGNYFYTLFSENGSVMKKMTILK